MKSKKIFLTALFALLLSSCNINSSNIGASSSEEVHEKPTTGMQVVDFYAINDFHGALLENHDFNEPGLAKVASFLKEKKINKPDQTVLLSSGDMWQGTFEAYHSKGEVVTTAMNDIGFDAMAIGNHEFDWGPSYITENSEVADFPLLGANIMKYPETDEKSEIGEEYVVLERGDLKIGVIGAIGKDQITSITSSNVADIHFADPTDIVINLSNKLRNEEEVDIVVLTIHTGHQSVDDRLARGGYVDAVFNAHTHRYEIQEKYGVPFVQGGDKGRYISHIQLTYDFAHNKLHVTGRENLNVDSLNLAPDPAVTNIIAGYKDESDIAANEFIGYATNDLDRYNILPNVANYVTALKAEQLNYDIDFVITNNAREDILSGDIYYRDLFKGLPFDNAIYIARATGRNLLSQVSYGAKFYRVNDYESLKANEYYTVAAIDYMLLHQNASKHYNYFTDYNPATDYIDILKDSAGNPLYPRDIVAEYFGTLQDKTLDPTSVLYNNDRYNNITV